ncbi:MAG: hypothetical protein CR954_00380 [Candidatus Moraniibacteriota bacterium]|nr:MAG: hypothetical protein CR954_00380 [Candidatus Moranbacteria bacterium]
MTKTQKTAPTGKKIWASRMRKKVPQPFTVVLVMAFIVVFFAIVFWRDAQTATKQSFVIVLSVAFAGCLFYLFCLALYDAWFASLHLDKRKCCMQIHDPTKNMVIAFGYGHVRQKGAKIIELRGRAMERNAKKSSGNLYVVKLECVKECCEKSEMSLWADVLFTFHYNTTFAQLLWDDLIQYNLTKTKDGNELFHVEKFFGQILQNIIDNTTDDVLDAPPEELEGYLTTELRKKIPEKLCGQITPSVKMHSRYKYSTQYK